MPTSAFRSNTWTSKPALAKVIAAVSPAGPDPAIWIFLVVVIPILDRTKIQVGLASQPLWLPNVLKMGNFGLVFAGCFVDRYHINPHRPVSPLPLD